MKHFKKYTFICLVIFTLFLIITPKSGHPYDTFCWQEWAKQIFNSGLGEVYHSFTDYLPLYHYILKGYVIFQNTAEDVHQNIHYLKLVSLLFHFITGYFIFRIVRGAKENWDNALLNTLFYLLNVAVLYNAMIWGQVDVILTCFIFISIYLAMQHKALLSLIFLLLALNFKLHAIIFVPVVGLMILPELLLPFSLKKILLGALVLFGVQLLILVPFINAGTLENVYAVVRDSVDKYPLISANAYNLWYLLVDGELFKESDAVIVHGLTYKNWGLLLFCLFSAFALFPLLKQIFASLKARIIPSFEAGSILIVGALIPLLFFYFNTQMHERYSHPALAFLITYSILEKKPVISILGSAAYLLNLEGVLHFLQLPKYSTLIFDERFISGLWLLTILGLFASLYKVNFKSMFNRSRN